MYLCHPLIMEIPAGYERVPFQSFGDPRNSDYRLPTPLPGTLITPLFRCSSRFDVFPATITFQRAATMPAGKRVIREIGNSHGRRARWDLLITAPLQWNPTEQETNFLSARSSFADNFHPVSMEIREFEETPRTLERRRTLQIHTWER